MAKGDARLWGDLCDSQADRFGAKTAFVNVDGAELSFAGYRARVNRLNNALAARGVRKGDRVAILARNCTEFAEVYGLAKSGIVVVPLNWRLTGPELLSLLRHCAPALIIADAQQKPVIDAFRDELGQVELAGIGAAGDGWLAYEDLLAQGGTDEPVPSAALSPDDVVCLMYTSGTTGAPKGVALTHRGILGNARLAAHEVLQLVPEDRTLAAMPMFHAGGMWYHLHASYAAGCTSVLMSGFEAGAVLAKLEAYAITNVHLVPTMISALLAHDSVGDADLRSLRLIFYAASSIPLELLRRAMVIFKGCGFLQSYGSTEAGMITRLSPRDHVRASTDSRGGVLASCGRPAGGNAVWVADDAGNAVAPGEIGEIMIHGGAMMAGYWNAEAATHAVMQAGWFRSGDLGYQDGEGYLYLVDRKNDMIVTGGENVYPNEVEQLLCEDPAIELAAVFGVPDPVWVERVVAAVVLRAGASTTPEQIIARLRGRLAAYKCPKQVVMHTQLPMNAAGKILKKDLKREFAGPTN
jgi:acyl-CoA synthetase (AMP-forming)/AMP-acid ligase II